MFTHDEFILGGGRADVNTTTNAISASVTQSTLSLTYGAAEPAAESFNDIAFTVGSLNVASGAFGLKANIAGSLRSPSMCCSG